MKGSRAKLLVIFAYVGKYWSKSNGWTACRVRSIELLYSHGKTYSFPKGVQSMCSTPRGAVEEYIQDSEILKGWIKRKKVTYKVQPEAFTRLESLGVYCNRENVRLEIIVEQVTRRGEL